MLFAVIRHGNKSIRVFPHRYQEDDNKRAHAFLCVISKALRFLVTPSMRRPIPVKSFLLFPDFFHFHRPAKPPLSPPFHPHSSGSEVRSVPVGCSRFSRRCYL